MAYIDVSGMTAVIYARVSTDDSDQRPEVQIGICRDWCQKNGVTVIGEFRDEHTGTELTRPGFTAMLGMIMINRPQLLVVRDQSRLTRDQKLEYIEGLISPYGTRIIYATNPDIDPHSLAGQMMGAIEGVINKDYVIQLRIKTKEGIEETRKAGTHVGRPAEFAIREDIDKMPAGKIRTEEGKSPSGKVLRPTKIISEALLYTYAYQGHSLRYLCRMEGVSPATLTKYLRGTTEPAIPGRPETVIPERLTRYLQIQQNANCLERGEAEKNLETYLQSVWKGGVDEKGVEPPENVFEKGVGE